MSLVTKGVHAKDSLLSNGYKYRLYVENLQTLLEAGI